MRLTLLSFIVCLFVGYELTARPLKKNAFSFVIDEEYDRYKKRGDDLFRQGDYERARKQYENCLEVPGFSNDNYSKNRVSACNQAVILKQRATAAQNLNKGAEAVDLLRQILVINPEDPVTKKQLADHWEEEGNKLYEQKQYADAKTRYQEALKYAEKKTTLTLQIQNCEQFVRQIEEQTKKEEQTRKDEQAKKDEQTRLAQIAKQEEQKKEAQKVPETIKQPTNTPITEEPNQPTGLNRRIGLKIATAIVGIGAGAQAYLIHKDFQTSLDALNAVGNAVDADQDGVITNQAGYDQWRTAYTEAQRNQDSKGLYYVCLGGAIGAGILEVFLLAAPSKPRSQNISLKPASQGVGLAVRYKF